MTRLSIILICSSVILTNVTILVARCWVKDLETKLEDNTQRIEQLENLNSD